MTIDPQRVQALFLAALEASDPVARRDFLDQQCGSDQALRQRVEALLAAHDAQTGFDADLSGPALGATLEPSAQVSQGTIIAGRYKLIEAIGEGGMGSVWVAEQKEPVKRKVAVKLIKAGMDSRQVLARFEAERQALALMDHPNIAKVFDGGVTDQGRPYFVMEYVKGVPLTEYCDQARLSLKERLHLFMPVCQAVQHAHQKGIIHRDLKPSNILICLYDGKPVPKVIDFGLAKAMHQSLTEHSLYTAHGMMVGTPLYMSPEQAEHNNLDVDSRTDIYSLGVILYELLTGSTPLERQQMKEAAFNEILRLIKEVEPPKPSTRLSSSLSLPSIAAQRSIEPNQLKRSVTGDLDWIVMKALDKERSRRYETANGLSRDIERFLNDEAVEACPPSTAYRLKKFIHRNRAMMMAVSAVAAALVLGMIGFAWQARVASYQRDLAVKARESEAEQRRLASEERDRAILAQQQEAEQRKLAEAARVEAETQKAKALEQEAEAKKQAAIAEAVAKFQTDMLAAVDPNQLPKDPVTKEPLKDAVTVVQAMEAAVKALDEGSLKDQPLVEASVRATIGNTFRGLARYENAEPNLRKSLAIRRAALPVGHPTIATSLNSLASLLFYQNKPAEAEMLFREALEINRAALPSGHPEIATGLNNLALLLRSQNKLAEAEPLVREALEIYRSSLPAKHPDIALGLNNLAGLVYSQNKLAEAEPLLREALEIYRASLPVGHPDIALGLNNLAGLLYAQNKLADAEPLYREALEIRRRTLPSKHPDIASSLDSLAQLLRAQNKLAEAEPLFRDALEINRVVLPTGHPDIAKGLNNLAGLLQNQNKLTEAEPLYREALEILRAAFPARHPQIGTILNNLALLLRAQNRLDEAEPLLREALEISHASLPAMHPDIAKGLNNLALLLRDQNKLDEAELIFREALTIYRASFPAGHPDIAKGLNNLALLLEDRDKLDEAEPLFREALEIWRASLSAGHTEIATGLENLSHLLQTRGKFDEAEPLLREALQIYRAALPAGHPDIANGLNKLGRLLRAQNKFAEAESLHLEALEIWRASLPVGHPILVGSSRNLFDLYAMQGRNDLAVALLNEVLASIRTTLPKDSPELAAQLLAFSLDLLELKAWDEAEALIREALAIREAKEPDDWRTFNTQSMLGGALLGQKKYAEAEPLLLAGYEGMKKREAAIPDQGKVRLPEALERLVQLYTAWHAAEPEEGYDAKAAEWQKKLDEYNAASATAKPASAAEQ